MLVSSNRTACSFRRSRDVVPNSFVRNVYLNDGNVMPEERLTEDLLARLRAAASPQENGCV